MMTRATPVAPALPAVDDSAANPLRPGTKPAWLLGAGGDPAAGAKLWSVNPTLYRWPPVSGVAHAIERAAIVSLLGGALLHPGHGSPVRLIAPPTRASCRPSGCSRWLQEVTVL